MGKPLESEDRIVHSTSRRVTVGKPRQRAPRSIQFRQTPNKIRGGRIGTASDAATYSRLTPSTGGTAGGTTANAATAAPSPNAGSGPRDSESGWSCRTSNWQWQGRSLVSATGWSTVLAQSGHPPVASVREAVVWGAWPPTSPAQHGWSQAWHSAFGAICAPTAAHAAKAHTSCVRLRTTAATPRGSMHSTQHGSFGFAVRRAGGCGRRSRGSPRSRRRRASPRSRNAAAARPHLRSRSSPRGWPPGRSPHAAPPSWPT